MTALRARWCAVISSDLVMDHLLEDGCKVLDDLGLELRRQALPDVVRSVGHDSTPYCSAREISSVTACDVSLVGRVGRGGATLVARSGILSTSWSRYATRTWPGEWSGANTERSGKRRPKSGCVGSVTSIS